MISKELTRTTNEPQLDSEDHYKILGVLPSATSDQIRLAYRQLVLAYHPDLKKSNNKDLFIKIKNSYETLIDPARRAAYDSETKNTSRNRNSSTTLQIEHDQTYFWRLRLVAMMSLASYSTSASLINSSPYFNNTPEPNFSRSPLDNHHSFLLDRNLIIGMFLLLLLAEVVSHHANNRNNSSVMGNNVPPRAMNENQSSHNRGSNQPRPAAASSFSYAHFTSNTSQPNSTTSNSNDRYSSLADIILEHVERANTTSLAEMILRHVEPGRPDNFPSLPGVGNPSNPYSYCIYGNNSDDTDDEFTSLLGAQRGDNADNESIPAAARVFAVTIVPLRGATRMVVFALLRRNLEMLFHSSIGGNGEPASSNSKIPLPKLSLNHQRLDNSQFDGEVPEEFICPLSSNVMSDPVCNVSKGLPNVERAWIVTEIERTSKNEITGTGKNPFNKGPLKISDLQSNTELKERIDKFVDVAVNSRQQNKPKI